MKLTRTSGFSAEALPKISMRSLLPLEGGVALVPMPASTTSGMAADARADVFEILRAGLPVFVSVFVNGDGDGHHVVRVVAEMRAENAQEAFAGGAGDGEKKDGERDLRGDERVVGALGAGAAGDAASAALHEARDVGARELESGREAEDDGGEDREADAEK